MKKKIILLIVLLSISNGCTDNSRARMWGGTAKVDLPKGEKLVSATWKDAELWYLTRPATNGEVPQTLTFHEKSKFGVMEGTVVFVEH